MSFYDAIRVGASGAADFEVERSVRNDQGTADTNSGSNFEKTYSSAGNQKTFTISVWVKKCNTPGNIGDDQYSIFSTGGGGSGAQNGNLFFYNDDSLYFASQPQPSLNAYLITTRKFRDPSAWYHIVIAVDTTQATTSNRVKMYINGVQETSFSTATYPSQNADLQFNQAVRHRVGSNSLGSNLNSTYGNFNGYIAEFNFIDGQQLTPASFAETNADTGQWNPKKYAGSYGTNGFYLKFADNSGTTATTLGKDSSGNGNNFTPNNFGTGDAVKDTPTNNFCTLNPLNSQNTTISEGNLKGEITNATGNRTTVATMGSKSGKWYYEVLYNSQSSDAVCIGFGDESYNALYGNNKLFEDHTPSIGYYAAGGGFIYHNTSRTEYSTDYTAGDIIGVAADLDNNQIYFYKNGTVHPNANPFNYTFSDTIFIPAIGNLTSGGNQTITANFGQDSTFAGAKTAQGNTDSNGKGDFYYSVPSGFKAICSANLPDPTILLPNEHFDTVLYSGNSSTQQINTSLTPDWVWVKSRSTGYNHMVGDTVRGANKLLQPNTNNGEYTGANVFTAFGTNSFTVGNDDHVNDTGSTYVAWNWNAGDTDSATYTVKVVSDGGNKYRFNNFGTSAVTLDLAEGGTYTFDQSDSSMSSHPMQLSTTANGTHGGGSAYSTGVTYQLDGSTVTASAFISGFSSASSRKLIITVAASAPTLYYYCYYHSGMGGAVNTNSTLGSSNFDGTIQTTVKADTTSGFSIIKWTGTGSAATIGHGLGVAPKWFVVKLRSGSQDWFVNNGMILNDLGKYYKLNSSGSSNASDTNVFPNTAPTSTVFSVGTDGAVNASGSTYVAYVFSEVEGYSKFTAYTGNGSTNGTFVYTGFTPTFMIQRKSSDENWHMMDATRDPLNANTLGLDPNLSSAEANDSNLSIDFLSNGFKLRTSHATANGSGTKYILLAFAESPFKNSRAR